MINADTLEILALNISNGKIHDFRILKESNLRIRHEIVVNVDNGYLGISKLHGNSLLPKKKNKKKPFTKLDKRNNKKLSSQRIFVEHVIGKLKFFKILSDRYRNRRKRFGLRFNLIASIYNFELKLKANN